MRLRVRENERLVRDGSNFAILNTDRSVINTHEMKMTKLKKEKDREDELNNIKRDVAEIKELLHQLLQSK